MPRIRKAPAGAESGRREKGSGEKPRWNAARNRWELRVTLDGKRKLVTGATGHETEKKREAELDAFAKGQPSPSSKLTLGDWLDSWLKTVHVGTLQHPPKPKRTTYRSYAGHVRVHLKPGLGDVPLVKLTAARVQAFFDDKMQAGESAANMGRVRATLRIALGRAKALGLVTDNVAGRVVQIPTADNSRVGKALEPEQVETLLEAAQSERNGPMIAFLVLTGLRLGEAQALRWRDVDERKNRLWVRGTLERLPGQRWTVELPKTEKSRRQVPLVPPALEILQLQRDRQTFEKSRAQDAWLDEGFVFANEQGDVTAQEGVRDAFKRSLVRAGIDPDHRVHDLRHTTVTYLIALGIPLPTVQAIVGHSTLAMTQRYAHVQEAMLDDAAERMATFFGGLKFASGGQA